MFKKDKSPSVDTVLTPYASMIGNIVGIDSTTSRSEVAFFIDRYRLTYYGESFLS